MSMLFKIPRLSRQASSQNVKPQIIESIFYIPLSAVEHYNVHFSD